jgi:peptidoglycan/xylan/chitin deacetylase (PgdA/CDA1 family)
MREALVTTSWDDGAVEDMRLAELLAKYGVPGCFYVPRSNPERPVMDAVALKQLAERFEIGGHTLRHLRLTSLPSSEARQEIHGCKAWLDDLTGRVTRSFCYPGGKYRAEHAREVARAGFENARTADWMCLTLGDDRYQIAPSLHLYPHSGAVHVAHCVRRAHFAELARYLLRFRRAARPSALASAMIDHIVARGGAFHLWGHSWEIAQEGLWDELEEILRAISTHTGLVLLDNAALARRIEQASAQA